MSSENLNGVLELIRAEKAIEAQKQGRKYVPDSYILDYDLK